jgi:hypothetical protein
MHMRGTSGAFRRFALQLDFCDAPMAREDGSRMFYDIGGVIVFLLDIWALIAILQSGGTPVERLIWVIIILVLPLVGFIVWYLIGPGSKRFPIG